jgi:hypothetical protein
VKKALIAVALLIGTAGPAWAVGGVADVTIYDRAENRTLPVYYHEGRYYVVGKPGNEYQVNIRSNQPGDVLGVIAIDGINAVSGETANWGQTGYVLGSYASTGIKGWRKSMQRIAAFYFTELENSYAARTGRPDNVGVIGVAVFRRKPEPAVSINRNMDQPRSSRAEGTAAGAARDSVGEPSGQAARADATAPPAATMAPAPVEKSLGTGHGQNETSIVRYTNFERAGSTPDEVITIYYDSYRNLLAQGVIKAPSIARPNPFPGQFVPDPR